MQTALSGKKVLVTRSKEQAKEFADKLTEAGAVPLIAPLLTFQGRVSNENSNMLKMLHQFNWLFFTSANGVKFFFELWRTHGFDTHMNDLQIAVVGRKTEQMLKHYGFDASFRPSDFHGSQLVAEFLQLYGREQRILFVCGNLSRQEIPNQLDQQHVFFRKMITYDTLINKETKMQLIDYIKTESIDVYTFTSPSTIDAFEELTNSIQPYIQSSKQQQLCLCIGTTTKKRAIQAGFTNLRVPDEFTIDGMIEQLYNYYK